MQNNKLTVCYFGSYDPQYSRNAILLSGLRQAGVHVIECNSRLSGCRKYLDLYKKYRRLRGGHDAIILGYSGYDGPRLLIFARLLTRKKIIFDAFFSVYDTFVNDRCFVQPRSLKARYYWWLERLAYWLADIVVYDTWAHVNYIAKTFRISPAKFRRIFVGANEERIYPLGLAKDSSHTIVEFHGGFIPLQGVDYIVRSAKILEAEGIIFRVIGVGQTYAMVRKLAEELGVNNIVFLSTMPLEEINREMAGAHICLGIFGASAKASNVIANKVFEALAAGCPTITGDSLAVRELLTNGDDVLLCHMGNPEDLAAKILELKNDQSLQQRLSAGGLKLSRERLTAKILGEELKNIIIEVL